jgi:hypothetical protein
MSGDADSGPVESASEISQFAAMLRALVEAAVAAREPVNGALVVERMTVDTPMEFTLAPQDGALLFDAEGPSQTIETSVLPVFHRIRATVALTEDGDG